MCWTMKPQFQGILAQAANLGQSVGNYTAEQFKAEYPQFCDAAIATCRMRCWKRS